MEISPVVNNRVSNLIKPTQELQQNEVQNLVETKTVNNLSEILDTTEKSSSAKESTNANSFLIQNLVPNWDEKNTTFENIKLNYPHWFNIATVALHALGGTLPSMPFIPKSVGLGFRNLAENFSRWCIPFSKVHNSIEAFKGRRLYEAVARLVPSLLIPLLRLPFHNFQLAYGLGSGINVVHEHIKSRVGLKAEDGFATNNKKIQDGLFHAIKDLFNGGDHVSTKERAKLGLTLGGGAAMILGAVPTLLFDRNGLNDGFARIFGSIRSLGGLLGDLSITLFPSHEIPELRKKEPIIGSLYLVPTFMDFAQRWMKQDEETNSIFNHVKTALNTIAELIWTHFSTIENQRAKESAAEKLTKAKTQEAPWLKSAHDASYAQVA